MKLVTFLLLGLGLSEGAVLSGKLTAADSSQPLAGASVLAFRQPLDPVRGPLIQKVQTASDGSYRFANVSAGSYRICVSRAGDYLDPCQWSQPVTVLVETADLTRDIALTRGVAVALIVADPNRLLPSAASSSRPLLNALLSDGAGRMHQFLFRNSGSQLEAVQVVPPGIALQLKVASKAFLLSDDKGMPIDERGHVIPLMASLPVPRRAIAPGYRLPFEAPGRKYGAVIRVGLRGLLPAGR